MNIYVYSDESGVFDYVHNEYYVYGGLILLSKDEKDNCERKYKNAEKQIAPHYKSGIELKASAISNADRGKLFRALNQHHKFGVIIKETNVHREIFENKKSKQRYLDYAYKIGIKNALKILIQKGIIDPSEVKTMHFFIDEHTTATDGRYELREGLLQEFKEGTFNYNYQTFFKPLFPKIRNLELLYCNSQKKTLIRAADIIANRLYHETISNNGLVIRDNLYIKELP